MIDECIFRGFSYLYYLLIYLRTSSTLIPLFFPFLFFLNFRLPSLSLFPHSYSNSWSWERSKWKFYNVLITTNEWWNNLMKIRINLTNFLPSQIFYPLAQLVHNMGTIIWANCKKVVPRPVSKIDFIKYFYSPKWVE